MVKKVMSLATASRNALLSMYLTGQRAGLDALALASREHAKALRMNCRALAIQKKPTLFSRARGRLWHQTHSDADASEIVHEGNEQALQAFIHENKASLEAELQALKKSKLVALQGAKNSALPMSVRQWLSWLDENDADFRALLERATLERKQFSKRLQPLPATVTNATSRIRPSTHTSVCRVPLLLRRPSGWYCFCQGDVRVVAFMCGIGADIVLVALQHSASGHQREFDFDLGTPVSQQATPATSLLESHGLRTSETFDLYVVTLRIARQSARELTFVLLTCMPAPPIPPHARRTTPRGVEEGDESDEAELFPKADSSQSSVCSSDESAMSSGTGESDGAGQLSADEKAAIGGESSDDGGGPKRAASGTYTSPWNDYFSLTNHPGFPDLKIRILDRWKSEALLGTKLMSKAMQPAAFGESKARPVLTTIVLRAWMVQRAQENGFAASKACRRHVFAKELQALRSDIQALTCGAAKPTTGNHAADAKLRSFLPELLQWWKNGTWTMRCRYSQC